MRALMLLREGTKMVMMLRRRGFGVGRVASDRCTVGGFAEEQTESGTPLRVWSVPAVARAAPGETKAAAKDFGGSLGGNAGAKLHSVKEELVILTRGWAWEAPSCSKAGASQRGSGKEESPRAREF